MDTQNFVTDYTETCGIVDAKLHSFDINSPILKSVHKEWLDDYVIPILASGGSVSLVGEASRTGKSHDNQRLSERRAKEVLAYLRAKCGAIRHACSSESSDETAKGVGEHAAATAGARDNTEDAFFRSVRLKAWRKATPPPPPVIKPKPNKLVKRVVLRTSESYEFRSSLGAPDPGFSLGNQAADKIFKPDTKRYDWCAREHVVIRIIDKMVIRSKRNVLGVETRTFHAIYYKWGPYTASVIFEHETYRNGKLNKKYPKELIPRANIWSRVKAPDS